MFAFLKPRPKLDPSEKRKALLLAQRQNLQQNEDLKPKPKPVDPKPR